MPQDEDLWSLPDSEPNDACPAAAAEEADGEGSDNESSDDCDEERRNSFAAHRNYLYDTFVRQRLDAPAGSVVFMPDLYAKGEVVTNRVLTGTMDVGTRQNYLTMYSLQLPERTDPHWLHQHPETGDLGGFEQGPLIKLEVEHRLYHDGPVDALAVWTANPCFYATRSRARSDVFVFNTAGQKWAPRRPAAPNPKLFEIPDTAPAHLRMKKTLAVRDAQKIEEWVGHTGVCAPDAVLTGLAAAGDHLDISSGVDGYIAASSADGGVGVWRLGDAQKAPQGGRLQPLSPCAAASTPFGDGGGDTVMRFSPHTPDVLLLARGKALGFRDVRAAPGSDRSAPAPYAGGAFLCADWNLHVPTLCVLGDEAGQATVVDVRNTSRALGTLVGHTDAVYSARWCPHQPSVLATGSSDCNVCLWDLRGRDSGCHAAATAGGGLGRGGGAPAAAPPKELFFMHTGHGQEVGDLAWVRNSALRGMVASVDIDTEAPTLQCWRPRNCFIPDREPDA